MYYLIDGFRSGFTGVAEANPLIAAGVTFGLAAFFSGLCYLLLRAGYKIKD